MSWEPECGHLTFGDFSLILLERGAKMKMECFRFLPQNGHWESAPSGVLCSWPFLPDCHHLLSSWNLFGSFVWIFLLGENKNCLCCIASVPFWILHLA